MINAVVLDFETRSKCDLKVEGTDKYAADPTTEVLCCTFYFLADGSTASYDPVLNNAPMDKELADKIAACDFYMAVNARFDQLVWEFVAVNDHDFPELDIDKWYCIAAQCRVNALPASLDKAARALNGKNQKDHKGAALIRKFSIPRKTDGEFNEMTVHDRNEMLDYCMKDTIAAADIVRATRLMTPEEHADWLTSERINDCGVKVDLAVARLAQTYATDEQEQIGAELKILTDGQVTKHSQHVRIKEFVLDELVKVDDASMAKAADAMTVYDKGEKKYSMAKDIRANLLAMADSGEINLTDEAYDVIMCSDEGNKSSVAKFKRMVGMADTEDHRVRGAFMFAGAGQTKRYSSKGLQVHNFSRTCFDPDEAEQISADMQEGFDLEDTMLTLSKMLRPSIIPDTGKTFVVGDWSAIEGRFLPWLANSKSAETVLDVFRNDEDIYLHTAAAMKIDDRQIGKVATLALGYQGGVNAFASMGRNYGLYLPEAQTKMIVDKWRKANPWAVKFWAQLEKAAILAMRNPEKDFVAGRLTYRFCKGLIGGTLLCILPNGDAIQYPEAKLETSQNAYGSKTQVTYLKASLTPAANAKEWPRGALYGGLMAENATQAIAAALLREKLRDLAGEPVVLHVHDEIVLEVLKNHADKALAMLQSVMEKVPAWAEGLPLKAEPEVMSRYGK